MLFDRIGGSILLDEFSLFVLYLNLKVPKSILGLLVFLLKFVSSKCLFFKFFALGLLFLFKFVNFCEQLLVLGLNFFQPLKKSLFFVVEIILDLLQILVVPLDERMHLLLVQLLA